MKTLIHRYQATAVFGALVIITPFLGIPNFFRTFILVILGGLIIVFGLTAKRRLTGTLIEESLTAYQITIPADEEVVREQALS